LALTPEELLRQVAAGERPSLAPAPPAAAPDPEADLLRSVAGGARPTQGAGPAAAAQPDALIRAVATGARPSQAESPAPVERPYADELAAALGGPVTQEAREQVVAPSPRDRGHFTGLSPDLVRAYQGAQEELRKQGISIFTGGPLTAKRTFSEQAYLRAKKGRQAAVPSPHAPHVAGRALDISAVGQGVRNASDSRVREILQHYGFKQTALGLGEPWHYEYTGSLLRPAAGMPGTVGTKGTAGPGARLSPPALAAAPPAGSSPAVAERASQPAIPWERVAGQNVFNPFTGDVVRPRNAAELAGAYAQGLVNPTGQGARNRVEESYRQEAMAGNRPLPPALSANPDQRAAQLQSIRQARPLLDRYVREQVAPVYDRLARVAQEIARDPRPRTPGEYESWFAQEERRRRAALLAEYTARLQPGPFLAYLKRQGVSVTPLQRDALLSMAAAHRDRLLGEAKVTEGDLIDTLTAAGAEALGGAFAKPLAQAVGKVAGPLAERAAGALGARLPAPVRAAAVAAGVDPTAQAAARVARKAFAPEGIAHGAIMGGVQQPATRAASDPHASPQDLLEEAAVGALGGALLAPAVRAGGEAVSAGVRRVLEAFQAGEHPHLPAGAPQRPGNVAADRAPAPDRPPGISPLSAGIEPPAGILGERVRFRPGSGRTVSATLPPLRPGDTVRLPELAGDVPLRVERVEPGKAVATTPDGKRIEAAPEVIQRPTDHPSPAAPATPPASGEEAAALFSTKAEKELRRLKGEARDRGYPPDEVKKLVDQFYQKHRYQDLEGRDNVYLVMPSTSGTNTLPAEFARRLQEDYGGQVVNGFAAPLEQTEAKLKTVLEKLRSPAGYQVIQDLAPYRGKHVVIVDDALTTGESVQGLRAALAAHGIPETGLSVLSSSDPYLVRPADMEALAKQLAAKTGEPYNEVQPHVERYFTGSFRGLVRRAITEAGDPEVARGIYDHIRGSGPPPPALPGDGGGAGPLQPGPGAGGAPAGAGVRSGPVSPVSDLAGRTPGPENQAVPLEPVPVRPATGLANQVQERELHLIAPPEQGVSRGAVEAQGEGRHLVETGEIDPERLAREIGTGERPFSWREAGALLEGKRRLVQTVNAARAELDRAVARPEGTRSPELPRLQQEYEAARGRLQEYVDHVQKGKTEWSNTGRALQAGTELDTGNFAEVIAEAQRRKGTPLRPDQETKLRELTGQIGERDTQITAITALEAERKRIQAEAAVRYANLRPGNSGPRVRKGVIPLPGEGGEVVERVGRPLSQKRQTIREQRAAIIAEIKEIAGSAAGRTHDLGSVTYEAGRFGFAAGKLGLTYIREGVATLDEVVTRVIAELKTHGIDATHEQVIDDIHEVTKGAPRTPSQLQAQIARLKAEVRRDVQLRSGEPPAHPAPRQMVSDRIAALQAQRDQLVRERGNLGQVQKLNGQIAALERGETLPAGKTPTPPAPEVATLRSRRNELVRQQAVKAEIADLEGQLRSGNYAPRPDRQARAVSSQLETLRAQRDLLSREVQARVESLKPQSPLDRAERVLGTVRGVVLGSDIGVLTRQGLFAWSHPVTASRAVGRGVRAALSETEMAKWELSTRERVINGRPAAIARKAAGLSLTDTLNHPEELVAVRLLKRLPLGVGRLSGGLERFQATFINSVRQDLFDQGLAAGWTPAELKLRAEFINASTGRGDVGRVPRLLRLLMTSPRYEASRWEMLAAPFKNSAALAGDLARGEGVNRAAVTNLRDMATTAAGVIALYKAAELAGYQTNWDPDSPDCLKMRKGDEVWSVDAGLAPRLRDVIRVYLYTTHPGYQRNLRDLFGKSAFRTLSPGVRVPIEGASLAYQKATGVRPQKTPFEGFKTDEERQGLITLAPLIVQSIRDTLQPAKKPTPQGPGAAAFTGAREFIGMGVNRYPKKQN
jgi:hypothetical protein